MPSPTRIVADAGAQKKSTFPDWNFKRRESKSHTRTPQAIPLYLYSSTAARRDPEYQFDDPDPSRSRPDRKEPLNTKGARSRDVRHFSDGICWNQAKRTVRHASRKQTALTLYSRRRCKRPQSRATN
jgi:hypothetical protein